MFKQIIALFTVALLTALFFIPVTFAATYQIDVAHSQIHFTVPHLVFFKVRGAFIDYVGSVEIDENQKITAASATIKVASINTREAKRDAHLRSADFFDADNHPEMTFVSTRIEYSGEDITAHGKLTIRGVTRDVALKGRYLGQNTDPWGNVRAGFEASTTINRQDYGLSWNKALETGGVVVGDEVVIALEVEAVLQK